MRFVSLFAGIGGFDLGLERAGMTCVGQVEIDPFCVQVLKKHWPDVPRHDDVRTFQGSEFGEFDLLCGGYPCQPFSVAGNRKGAEDERHLWPEVIRIIRNVRPRIVLLENVPGHLSLGFGRVLGDLAESGYDAEWDCIPASAVGAPHQRDRVWIVAYPNRAGCGRLEEPHGEPIEPRKQPRRWSHADGLAVAARQAAQAPARIGRVDDGIPHWSHRLRSLGNAVVPQVAEWIARRIMEAHK